MMDSFVEAQNRLKRMSYRGAVTPFKTRQSHAVRFSFIPVVMKSLGLKPIEVQNARSSSACFLTWLPCAGPVASTFLGEPDRSAGINDTLADIAARRAGWRKSPVPGQRPWNRGLLIDQKPLEPKYVWSIRVRTRNRTIKARPDEMH